MIEEISTTALIYLFIISLLLYFIFHLIFKSNVLKYI